MKNVFSLNECLQNKPWEIRFSNIQALSYRLALKDKKGSKGLDGREFLLFSYLSFLLSRPLSYEDCMEIEEKGKSDPDYMFLLSRFHSEGYPGFGKDPEKAFGYLLSCAESKDQDAYLPLSLCYGFGDGVKQDIKKAYETLEKSTPNDRRSLMFALLRSNDDDCEVRKRGLFELECFAKRGNPDAYYYLGRYYESIDQTKAMDYFLEGSNLKSARCNRELGYIHLHRKGRENRYRALAYFLLCQGYKDCTFLASLLLLNLNTADMDILFSLLLRSSDQGNLYAYYLKTLLFYRLDHEAGLNALLRLAKNNSEACHALSILYRRRGKKNLSVYFERRGKRELDGKDVVSIKEYYLKEYPFPELFDNAENHALMLK